MPKEHQKNPWGFGNSSARWNPAGYPIIYTASQLSLCTTELMAILGTRVRLHDWCRVVFKVTGAAPFFSKNELPHDWNHRPHPITTQEMGKDWLVRQKSAVMAVPSARLPLSAYTDEFNLLMNPLHPNLRNKVSVVRIETFAFALND